MYELLRLVKFVHKTKTSTIPQSTNLIFELSEKFQSFSPSGPFFFISIKFLISAIVKLHLEIIKNLEHTETETNMAKCLSDVAEKPITLLHSASKNLCEDQIISPVIEVEELCCHIELYWI